MRRRERMNVEGVGEFFLKRGGKMFLRRKKEKENKKIGKKEK